VRKAFVEKPLPDKLSALITAALKDLSEAEKSPRCTVDMRDWYHPRGDQCSVCLAGATIAARTDYHRRIYPAKLGYGSDTFNKLTALDTIRCGGIESALTLLGLSKPRGLPDWVDVTDYADNPKKFKAAMRNIAKRLREHGA
jgi:hypothetical protein